jgi:hypothetical protein
VSCLKKLLEMIFQTKPYYFNLREVYKSLLDMLLYPRNNQIVVTFASLSFCSSIIDSEACIASKTVKLCF